VEEFKKREKKENRELLAKELLVQRKREAASATPMQQFARPMDKL